MYTVTTTTFSWSYCNVYSAPPTVLIYYCKYYVKWWYSAAYRVDVCGCTVELL